MSTTAIIVEMLIIGFFTAVWIFLFFVRFLNFGFQVESLKGFTSQIGPWSAPLLLFVAAALFYQLGLLMNWISYILAIKFLKTKREKLRDEMIPGKKYAAVKVLVWQKGSQDIIKNIEGGLSIIRLARAGIINFFLIAMALFMFGYSFVLFGIISLLICIACIPLWLTTYDLYYERMKFAYEVIEESERM